MNIKDVFLKTTGKETSADKAVREQKEKQAAEASDQNNDFSLRAGNQVLREMVESQPELATRVLDTVKAGMAKEKRDTEAAEKEVIFENQEMKVSVKASASVDYGDRGGITYSDAFVFENKQTKEKLEVNYLYGDDDKKNGKIEPFTCCINGVSRIISQDEAAKSKCDKLVNMYVKPEYLELIRGERGNYYCYDDQGKVEKCEFDRVLRGKDIIKIVADNREISREKATGRKIGKRNEKANDAKSQEIFEAKFGKMFAGFQKAEK